MGNFECRSAYVSVGTYGLAWCLYGAHVQREGSIKRVRAGTECAIGEEQCWFRHGRGCMHQDFAVRQIFEKYLANWKYIFWAIMDLEQAYYTIDRHGMWQMLRVYGVGGKLLKVVQSFHINSRACVRLGNDVREWLPVSVASRQSCVRCMVV